MARHRSHSIEFKRQVAQEFIAEAGAFDEDAEAPLGRFVLAHRLGREVYDLGQRYGMLVRRFYASRGIPLFFRDRGELGARNFRAGHAGDRRVAAHLISVATPVGLR